MSPEEIAPGFAALVAKAWHGGPGSGWPLWFDRQTVLEERLWIDVCDWAQLRLLGFGTCFPVRSACRGRSAEAGGIYWVAVAQAGEAVPWQRRATPAGFQFSPWS